MKIDSGLSGYYYPNRTADIERKQDDAPQAGAPAITRSPGALTGSSTLLSNSLANALWVMEAGTVQNQPAAAAQDWVRDVYQEFN